jgi:hypothetical protein
MIVVLAGFESPVLLWAVLVRGRGLLDYAGVLCGELW